MIEATKVMSTRTQGITPRTINWLVLFLFIYAVGVYAYMTLRFVGNWGEGDTTVVARGIFTTEQAESIREAKRPYTNGSGYVALSVFLQDVTGLSLQDMQTYVLQLLPALGVVVIFVTYRLLIGRPVVALIATLFVFIQGDFLWVTWRGSHEKMTWILVCLCFYILARSFTVWKQPWMLLRYILLFYIIAFALTTSNVFFASSFIVALVLSFAGGQVYLAYLTRRNKGQVSEEQLHLRTHIRRLLYVNMACLVLLFLFLFYIYPPAFSGILFLRSLVEQLSVIFLQVELRPTVTAPSAIASAPVFSVSQPANYLAISWLSPVVFLVLTLFSWLVLLTSFVTWAAGVLTFVIRKNVGIQDLPRLLMWLVYPAFALQLVGALFADRGTVLSGNLQVRLFTPLMLLAIPLAAIGVSWLLTSVRRPLFGAALRVAIIVAVAWFSTASLLKGTNEPVLNNKWVFTSSAENAVGDWLVQKVTDADVWTGTDERIASVYNYRYPELLSTGANMYFVSNAFTVNTKYVISSELERLRQGRLQITSFNLTEENSVYDNGDVQVIYRRPRSPFQR